MLIKELRDWDMFVQEEEIKRRKEEEIKRQEAISPVSTVSISTPSSRVAKKMLLGKECENISPL